MRWPKPQTLVVYSDGRKELCDVKMDVFQIGRVDFSGDCVATMIDRLTCPTKCVISTAGDSSRCLTCGHRFDTNTLDGNLPPDCQGQIDPFRGGILT